MVLRIRYEEEEVAARERKKRMGHVPLVHSPMYLASADPATLPKKHALQHRLTAGTLRAAASLGGWITSPTLKSHIAGHHPGYHHGVPEGLSALRSIDGDDLHEADSQFKKALSLSLWYPSFSQNFTSPTVPSSVNMPSASNLASNASNGGWSIK